MGGFEGPDGGGIELRGSEGYLRLIGVVKIRIRGGN